MSYFKISEQDRQRLIDMIAEAPAKYSFNVIQFLLKLEMISDLPLEATNTGIVLPEAVE